jgi:uncharacterized membrane protein YdcZ (DUF606 family)
LFEGVSELGRGRGCHLVNQSEERRQLSSASGHLDILNIINFLYNIVIFIIIIITNRTYREYS